MVFPSSFTFSLVMALQDGVRWGKADPNIMLTGKVRIYPGIL